LAKLVTRRAWSILPWLQVDHSKLATRLHRFCGIELKGNEAFYSFLRVAIAGAVAEWHADRSSPAKREVAAVLKRISDELKFAETVLSHDYQNFEMTAIGDAGLRLRHEMKTHTAKEFRQDATTLKNLSKAAGRALAEVQGIASRAGAPTFDWYDRFIYAMVHVANASGVKITTQGDRTKLKRLTPFLAIVSVYEMCLPKGMRSRTREARASRISSSLKRVDPYILYPEIFFPGPGEL
jgi:hypothetical protein